MEEIIENDTKSTTSTASKMGSSKTAVKLYEIGPRLELKLMKIQEGFMKGNVVYHRLVNKSELEKETMRKRIKEKMKKKEDFKLKQ